MSRAWSWRNAILKSKLPATTKHVLMVISCHMNDMGEGCYPSTKRIAEYASLSERSVCTHIEDAGKAGWLEVKTHGYSGQGWARHEYLPLWPEGTELASAPPAERTEPRARGTEPDDNKALKEVQRNISGEQLTEQHIGRPRFDFFWDLYPRKVSRPHAEKAWRSVDGDRKYAEIMAGLRRWVNSADWKERPADKLPYPATWLNGERWNDLPSVVVKPLGKGEIRVRQTTPEEDARTKLGQEFMRLAKLPENLRKSEAEIWEMVEQQNGSAM